MIWKPFRSYMVKGCVLDDFGYFWAFLAVIFVRPSQAAGGRALTKMKSGLFSHARARNRAGLQILRDNTVPDTIFKVPSPPGSQK